MKKIKALAGQRDSPGLTYRRKYQDPYTADFTVRSGCPGGSGEGVAAWGMRTQIG